MSRHRMMRLARRLTLCLVMGAAITVAMAWIVAVTVTPTRAGNNPGGQTVWSLPSGIGDGWSYWTMRDTGTLVVVRVRAHFEMRGELRDAYLDVRRRTVPAWSGIHQAPPAGTSVPQPLFLEDARGWPMLALRSTHVVLPSVGPNAVSIDDGILVKSSPTNVYQRTVLPLRPIWPAFIIDSMLFGTIVYAGIFGLGAMRRRRRRRHGQCERCGYDMRAAASAACPECGALHSRRSEAAAG